MLDSGTYEARACNVGDWGSISWLVASVCGGRLAAVRRIGAGGSAVPGVAKMLAFKQEYDRMLWLDSDIVSNIVSNKGNAEDLLAVVPEGKIGVLCLVVSFGRPCFFHFCGRHAETQYLG